MIDANEIFNRKIDRWICAAVNNGATSFNSLLNALPGVYPSVALDSLKRLTAAGEIPERLFSVAHRGANGNNHQIDRSAMIIGDDAGLPVPHPLDYDWRFSDAAADYLLDHCSELTEPHETLVFLGTPSVCRRALKNSFPRKTLLLDNNIPVVNYFSQNLSGDNNEATPCDIVNDAVPAIEASAVIADPPWYENDLLGFMWTAAEICRLDGHILISLPPVGTRPGIEEDLARFFEYSKSLGLILVKEEKAILPYISPPFEKNALKAQNFHSIDEQWRRGDLAIFMKKRESLVERPMIRPNSEPLWLEETVRGVRIKLKPDDAVKFKDPGLLRIVKHDIFPTVSRRDERRCLAEVWTSGNRVFACEGRFVLREILRELASERSAIEVLSEKLNRSLMKEETILIQKSKRQLMKIITREREENQIFAGGNN